MFDEISAHTEMYKSSIVIGICVDLYIILHVKEEFNRTYDTSVLWYF